MALSKRNSRSKNNNNNNKNIKKSKKSSNSSKANPAQKKKYVESKLKQMCMKMKAPARVDIVFRSGYCWKEDEGGGVKKFEDFYKKLQKMYGPKSFNPKNFRLDYNELYEKMKA